MSAILHWFRRDLRLHDNTALAAAARDADRVIPVFVLDDHYGDDPGIGPARFYFLKESLEELERAISAAGGNLVLLPGPAEKALPELLVEAGARAVYANTEVGPYPEARDRGVRDALASQRAELRLFGDALLVEPDALLSGSGGPYTVYGPFAKKWEAAEKRRPEPEISRLAAPGPPISGVPLGRVRAWRHLSPPAGEEAPRGGEAEALRLLREFADPAAGALARYSVGRDRPAERGTSRLSPHLHFGTISPRTILAAVENAGTGAGAGGAARTLPDSRKFLLELAWRDFYHHVLFHFPRVAEESFRPEFDRLAWREDPGGVAAWKAGRTGYPFVDAGMRQLATTHWMHNRARMAVASFLTRDLHVHWREGEKWFAHELADADLANNNGGWQWAAGSGTDAAPYFRIFNPILQSKRFDPDGAWIRKLVPELARVPAGKIHEPWTMTGEEQSKAGCRIGKDYPAPIVDHAKEREVAMAMFAGLRKGNGRAR